MKRNRLKLTTNDGAVFRAFTRPGLVARMRDDQWNAPVRKLEYSAEVVERLENLTGKLCPLPITVDTFLDYLVSVGVATITSEAAT